jgi:hypothetical protein
VAPWEEALVAALLTRRFRWLKRLGWLPRRRWVAAGIAAFALSVVVPFKKAAADPSDWVCTWNDGPRLISHGTRCEGGVHCRLAKAFSFKPMVRKVDCPSTGNKCEAEVCLESALQSERAKATD